MDQKDYPELGIKTYSFMGNELHDEVERYRKENRDERITLSIHDWAMLMYSDMLYTCTKERIRFHTEKDFDDLLDKLWEAAEELYTIIDIKNKDLNKVKLYVKWTIVDMVKLFDFGNRHGSPIF